MGSESFLSASWYRVAGLRPRLAAGARVRRHRYRGQVWYVLGDAATARMHRLAPPAYAIVAGMDGARTVDALWRDAAVRLGEEAPSQDQVIQLLEQLHASDLLRAELAPDTEELLSRHTRDARGRWLRMLANPMSLRFRLLNPDRFLTATAPAVRWMFGPVGALAWLACVVPALAVAAQHWAELTANVADRVLAVDNLVFLAVCVPGLKALHELAHGYAVKRWGGAVHDMGIMLMVLLPMPYVDATASWHFQSKWRRALVGAAGMMAELFVASLATFAWLLLEPGVGRALAFNTMVAACVTTVVFNANPLLRYDGYFILCDVIEIPNLGQRATQFVQHLVDRFVLRLPGADDAPGTRGERAWFLFYAPASYAYRMLVMVSIALLLASHYFVVGAALAAWTLVTGLAVPLGKLAWAAMASPRLAARRRRAMAATAGALAGVAALLLLVPAPLHLSAEGVVWLPDNAVLRAGTDGFALEAVAHDGAAVVAGDAVLRSEEPVVKSHAAMLRGRVAELEAELDAERFTDRIAAAVTLAELTSVRDEQADTARKMLDLTVTSVSEGTLVLPREQDVRGRFFREGTVIGYVLPRGRVTPVVRATLTQDDVELVRGGVRSVRVRLAGDPATAWPATLLREAPEGRDQLPSRALGSAGGGEAAVDPRDQNGTKTMQRVFEFDLALPERDGPMVYGGRAAVRFDLAWQPLGEQVFRRLRQLVLSRLHA